MTTIKVLIDRESNLISVYNNGRGIPVTVHKEEGVYVPELIFGHLLTSSNYDDNQKKVTGGRNGYGAKLCNIFSTEFIVETADKERELKYRQTFNDNMSKKGKPRVTANKRGEEFTRISFKPDLAKFKLTEMDEDFEALIKKRVYDLAGCVQGVSVYLNGTKIPIKSFPKYAELYTKVLDTKQADNKKAIVHDTATESSDRWQVSFSVSDGQFNQVRVNIHCMYIIILTLFFRSALSIPFVLPRVVYTSIMLWIRSSKLSCQQCRRDVAAKTSNLSKSRITFASLSTVLSRILLSTHKPRRIWLYVQVPLAHPTNQVKLSSRMVRIIFLFFSFHAHITFYSDQIRYHWQHHQVIPHTWRRADG